MSTAVASIAENTGGGLYAYRCSKAGLNMSMKVSFSLQSDNFFTPMWTITSLRAFLWTWRTQGCSWWRCTQDGFSQRWGDQMHRFGQFENSIELWMRNVWFLYSSSDYHWNLLLHHDSDSGRTHGKGNLISIVTSLSISYQHIHHTSIYHGRKICIMRIRCGLLHASAPISINVEPDVSEPCWGWIYIIPDAAYI